MKTTSFLALVAAVTPLLVSHSPKPQLPLVRVQTVKQVAAGAVDSLDAFCPHETRLISGGAIFVRGDGIGPPDGSIFLSHPTEISWGVSVDNRKGQQGRLVATAHCSRSAVFVD